VRISGPYILIFAVVHLLASLFAPLLLGGFIMASFDSDVPSTPLQDAAALFLPLLYWPTISLLSGLPPEIGRIAAFVAIPLNSVLWAFITWGLIQLTRVVLRRVTNRRLSDDA